MSEKTSAVNHEAMKPESVKQTIDGFESQLLEASDHIDEAQAKVDALDFKSDATDHVYAKTELRDAREQYQPVLDSLSEQWATHGGARIDAARAAVDALDFKSDATDHVYAKTELRDAEDAWVESYNAAQQEQKPNEPEEEVLANETGVKESESVNAAEESAAVQVQDNEVLSPLDHPVEVAVRDGESFEEYEERIGANRELVPLIGDSIKINDPLEFTANDAEGEQAPTEEAAESQNTPEAEVAPNTNKLTWRDALRNPGGYLAAQLEKYRFSDRRVTRNRILGAVTIVAVAYLAYRSGTELFGDHSALADAANNAAGNHPSSVGGGNVAPTPTAPSVEAGGHGQDWTSPNYSEAARTVTDGEGFNQTFLELNIPESEWPSLLQKVGPQLAEQGWAYPMPNGSWGISHTGTFPDSVLQLIQSNR